MDQRWARGPGTPETRPCSCETARAWHVGWTWEPAPPRPRPEPVFRERFTHTVVSEGGSLAPPAGGACTWLPWPPWQREGSCAKKGEKENCCDHSKGGRKLSPPPPPSPRGPRGSLTIGHQRACRGIPKPACAAGMRAWGSPTRPWPPTCAAQRRCWAFFPSLSSPIPPPPPLPSLPCLGLL